MKNALFLTLLVATTGAFGQDNSLPSLAEEASLLVRNYSETLSREDQITVRRNLRHIVALFRTNGQTLCERGTNKLIDLNSGALIYDFYSSRHCESAVANLRVGKPFCVQIDNTLRSIHGLIHDFSRSNDCREASESVFKYGKFCDYSNNTLRSIDGRVIYDFNSSADCRKALEQN